ncbi:ATP-binding protein [Methanoregula sp.]|uniref:ATP-binding protein n=1 Tax=Methanoregula sp. TaxID=2052170 RepID=UPI00236B8026|nr:ATP-binding protein [Methanoregula sp.]MDD1686434.1 ATP-binding protein [Methanoregula sp.]
MVSKEVLRHLVIQQKTQIEQPGDLVERTIFSHVLDAMNDNRVLILTGIRRCGKSTLLKQLMQGAKNYCYINFEDERLLSFRAEDFGILDEVLIEVYGSAGTYFFDEIQNVEKFETFVRRLQDNGKKIILTGSNASLLSREFGTRLTGRYKLFEVYPFSFIEYLRFIKTAVRKESLYLVEEKVNLTRAFGRYVESGGMPEYLRNNDPEYLKTLYDNILYRDIIARYSIRRQRLIRELVGILASTVTLPFTYNSLKKNLGLMNAITVKEYISYLSGAYLFFELLRFDYSLKKQLGSPRKIYCIDTALCVLNGFSLTPNNGRLLENVVFIELKRRGGEIFYFAGKRECDFILKDQKKITMAIQVCYEFTAENRERETKGLLEAMETFDLSRGMILTYDQEDELQAEGKTIVLKPVWKWLLEESVR